jgi:hypothetical protein
MVATIELASAESCWVAPITDDVGMACEVAIIPEDTSELLRADPVSEMTEVGEDARLDARLATFEITDETAVLLISTERPPLPIDVSIERRDRELPNVLAWLRPAPSIAGDEMRMLEAAGALAPVNVADVAKGDPALLVVNNVNGVLLFMTVGLELKIAAMPVLLVKNEPARAELPLEVKEVEMKIEDPPSVLDNPDPALPLAPPET